MGALYRNFSILDASGAEFGCGSVIRRPPGELVIPAGEAWVAREKVEREVTMRGGFWRIRHPGLIILIVFGENLFNSLFYNG